MIFTCNINNKGWYDSEYSYIGFYQKESTQINPVITANEVPDGMNFNNENSGMITPNHDKGELKLYAYQNGANLSHQKNEVERQIFWLDEKKEEKKNFTLDETKQGKIAKQNMVMFNRLELGEQNANQVNKKDTVV